MTIVKFGQKTGQVMYLAGKPAKQGSAAFTLIEVMAAVFVFAIVLVTLFGSFTAGFAVVEAAREDLRATQILVQQTEAVRLCTWGQMTNYSFTAYYDPQSAISSGILYTGTLTTNAANSIPSSASYSPNICLVTVNLTWTNYTLKSPIVHTRQMQTQVARYGIQNYIIEGAK